MKKIKLKTKRALQTTTWVTLLCTPALVQAMECNTNADCAQGEQCQLLDSIEETCTIDEEGTEICSGGTIETFGICVELPIECMTDTDCPSHLKCVEGGGAGTISEGSTGMATEGSTGSEGATDPAPPPEEGMNVPEQDLPPPDEAEVEDGPNMCAFIPTECETNAECGSHFHCQLETYFVGCGMPTTPVVVNCDEGEDCLPDPADPVEEPPPCEAEEITEGYCVPDEIDCAGGEICPDDWRCREVLGVICEGENVNATDDQPSAEIPDQDPSADFVEEPASSCEETMRSLCVPVGMGFGGGRGALPGGSATGEIASTGDGTMTTGTGGSGAAPTTPETEEGDANQPESQAAGSSADVEDSGCSASTRSASPWALFGLFALLGLRRRAQLSE